MGSSFAERIDVLKELVGHGDLTGTVVVDQVYAAIQLPCTIRWTSAIPEAGRRCTSRRRCSSTRTVTFRRSLTAFLRTAAVTR